MPAKQKDTILAGGEASKVILRSFGPKKVVIKSAKYGDVGMEAAALKILHSHGVPVPRPLRLSGRTLSMEYILGKNAQEVEMTPLVIRKIAKAIRKMHSVREDVVGKLNTPSQNTLENWRHFLEQKMERGLVKLNKKGFLSHKEAALLKARFAVLARKGIRSFTPTIVHSDLHLDNIRITPKGKAFLIDFENPFWGDGLYDLAPFHYFHPSLYRALRKAYSSTSFPREREALRLYLFLHAIDIGSFYADIGGKKQVEKALNTARSGRVS